MCIWKNARHGVCMRKDTKNTPAYAMHEEGHHMAWITDEATS